MNETCDRCGPAVCAAYRVDRSGELYLCRHCTNLLWPALSAQVLQSRFRGMSSERYVPRRTGRRSRLHAVTSFRPLGVRLPLLPGGSRGGTTGRRPGAACARPTSAARTPGGRG